MSEPGHGFHDENYARRFGSSRGGVLRCVGQLKPGTERDGIHMMCMVRLSGSVEVHGRTEPHMSSDSDCFVESERPVCEGA
jgi:hypothetical protein